MKCGVVTFPGSNCDYDCFHVLSKVFGLDTESVWHKNEELGRYDLIVVPGGFSYGDYLRPGAIARFSPVMKSLVKYVKNGGRLIGICNGFQILTEAGLLPGALMRNRSQSFICKPVHVRVENNQTPFTGLCSQNAVLKIPIAHADGCYYAEPDTVKRMEDNGQIVFRYCGKEGTVDDAANPNGSLGNIAGVANESKTVLGMMPHPERCSDPLWPDTDGQIVFRSLIQSL